jgi:hypothetical protein
LSSSASTSVSTSASSSVSTTATSTVTTQEATSAIECITLNGESYFKVEQSASGDDLCTPHARKLNAIVEDCIGSKGGLVCEETTINGKHTILRAMTSAACGIVKDSLNKVMVDFTAYVDEDFGTLQCTPGGFLKDSTDDHKKCAVTAAVLNKAIEFYQSGEYTNCDYTTATSTPTGSNPTTVTTTLTSTETTTVTTQMYGNLECLVHDGTGYIRSVTDCQTQVDVVNDILEACDSDIAHAATCSLVANEYVLKATHDGCPTVASSLNTAVEKISFPNHGNFDGGVNCTVEGFVTVSIDKCKVVAELLNDAIDDFLAGKFLACSLSSFTTTATTSVSSTETTSVTSTVSTSYSSTASSTAVSTETSTVTTTVSTSVSTTETSSVTSSVTSSATSTASSTGVTTGTTTLATLGSTTLTSTPTSTATTTVTTTVTTSMFLQIRYYSPERNAVDVDAATEIVLTFPLLIRPGDGYIVFTPKPASLGLEPTEILMKDTTQVRFATEIVSSQAMGVIRIQPTKPLTVGQEALKYRVSITRGSVLEAREDSSLEFKGLSIHDYQFTLKDTVAPNLVATYPKASEVNVPVDIDSLVLTFNEPVAVSSNGALTIVRKTAEEGTTSTVYTSNNITVTFANGGKVATLKPTAGATAPFFEASISGVKFSIAVTEGFFIDAGKNAFSGIAKDTYTFSVADGTPPVIIPSLFKPANNSINVDASSAIEIHFSEPVVANTGNIIIRGLGAGGEKASCIVAVVDTTQVTIDEKVVTVKCDGGLDSGAIGRTFEVLIEGGALVDKSDSPNKFAGTVAAEFVFSVADTAAPAIVNLYPGNGAREVTLDTSLILKFTEPVVPAAAGVIKLIPSSSGATISININDGTQVKFNETTKQVMVTPSAMLTSHLQEQTYTVLIDAGAIVDANGLPFNGFVSKQWTFQIVDALAPSLNKIRPRNGSENVAINAQFILTFDEPMARGSGEIYIVSTYPSDHKIAIDVEGDEVFITDNIVRIIPFELMDSGLGGRTYSIECASGVFVDDSKSANPFAGFANIDYSFSVVDTREPFISSFLPVRGAEKVERNISVVLTLSEKVAPGNGYITLLGSETGKVKIHVSQTDKVEFGDYTITLLASNNLAPGRMGQTYRIEVDDGAILDLNGNSLPPLYGNDYYFTMMDDVHPSLLEVLPASDTGAVFNHLTSDVTLRFTEPVAVAAVADNKFPYRVSGYSEIQYLINSDWNITGSTFKMMTPLARLAPLQVLTEVSITFIAESFKDASGNDLDVSSPEMTLTYNLVDLEKPQLIMNVLEPLPNAVDVHTNTAVVLRFNEPVAASIGNIIIQGLGEGGEEATCTVAIIDTTQVTVNDDTVVVQCNGGLVGGPVGRTFQVLIENGALTDLSEPPNPFDGTVAGEYLFTIDDTSPPLVLEALPANHASGAALNSSFVLTFNEEIQIGNFSEVIMFTPSAAGPTFTIAVNDSSQVYLSITKPFTLTVTPNVGFASALQTQTYNVIVPSGAYKDVQNNIFAGIDHMFTVEDRVGPSIISVLPLNGANAILRHSPVVIKFDQPIVRGHFGKIFIESTTDASEVWQIDAGDSQLSLDGTALTVYPYPALLRSHRDRETYAVSLDEGVIQDTANVPNIFGGAANVTVFTVVNSFQNVSVVPTVSAAGKSTAIHVSFVTLSEINNFDSIVLRLPKVDVGETGFDFNANTLSSGFHNIHPIFTMHFVYGDNMNGYIVVQKIGGQLIDAISLVEFALTGISLPRVLGMTGNYALESMDVKGRIKEQYVSIPGTNVTNDYAPQFEKDAYDFSMDETAIFEECGEAVIFRRLGNRIEMPGACTPNVFAPTLVGTVTAADADYIPGSHESGHFVFYSIVAGEGSSYFSINEHTGDIFTRNYIDFEGTRPTNWDGKIQFTLIVQAVDASPPFRASTTTVIVSIHDANDRSPSFFLPPGQSYFDAVIHATEESSGQTVALLTATDGDIGVNAQLQFSLDDTVVGFSVDKFTGEVKRNTEQLSETAPYATFYAYVQDTPSFPQEPRVSGVLVNVKVISDANLIFNNVAYSGGASFNKDTYETSMTAILCSTGSCTVKVWSAPGVISGELVDANPPLLAIAPISYYVDGVQPEPEVVIVVQETVVFIISGTYDSDILDDLSETTKQGIIDDVQKNVADATDLKINQLLDGALTFVAAGGRRRATGELRVTFTLAEDVTEFDLAAAIARYNEAVANGEVPQISFVTMKNADKNVAQAGAAAAGAPIVNQQTSLKTLDASSSSLYSASDVQALMNDPAVAETMTQLSDSMGFQNEVTDVENFVAATISVTTISNATNDDVEDDDLEVNSNFDWYGLGSQNILAIIASLSALLICAFSAACIFGCACCRGAKGKEDTFSMAHESDMSTANTIHMNPSIDASATSYFMGLPSMFDASANSYFMQPSVMPSASTAVQSAPSQLPYFDVMPEMQANDQYDYNVDDELAQYGNGDDIQFILDGGDPNALMGGMAAWDGSAAQVGYDDQGQQQNFANGQPDQENNNSYDQGYNQERMDQGNNEEQGYDQEAMDYMNGDDQQFFDQPLQNPLHASNAQYQYNDMM